MELISIIIPVYKNNDNLKKCLDSALNQKYPNTEIILVSDGAPRDVYYILNDYYERYTSMIRLLDLPHQGVMQARLKGLEAAQGSYIIFLDSDDYLNKIYLYELMYTKKYTDSNVILAKMDYLQNRLVTESSTVFPREFRISEDKRNLLKIDSSINGKLFKKSSIKLPDYHLKANETSPYLYYYLTKEDKIGFSSFSKYYVRKGKNTLRNSYLEDGLGYVENVIRPLDIMYNLYKSGKLLNEYYEEIEALFIRDIFLEIERVKRNVHTEDTRVKLINILLKYLNFHFPNWRSNRYLKKNFIDFNKDIFFKLNRISLEMKHFKTRGVLDSSEAIRSFKRVLK